MDRPTFLKTMLGSAALLTLPPWAMLNAKEQDRLAWTQDRHGVFVFDAFVKGFRRHKGPELLLRIKAEDPLDLVREHDNPHDPNAVGVYRVRGEVDEEPLGL